MRRTFHEQLDVVEGLCVEMAGLVLRQLERVIPALTSRDVDAAQQVVADDDLVDDKFEEIERRILQLMATQAPVASDLRLISAIMHINIHLERMGDLCTNIAKFVRITKDFPISEEIMTSITEMGAMAARMIDTSIQSFAQRDLEMALSLTGLDEPINRLNRKILRSVASYAGDEQLLEWAMRMVLVSRYLERLGDQAVDIGEQVAFIITGEFKQFTDASHKADPGVGLE